MTEDYALTLGELKAVIEAAISEHGTDAPYILVGCYQSEGLIEKDFRVWLEDPDTVRLFTNTCSG